MALTFDQKQLQTEECERYPFGIIVQNQPPIKEQFLLIGKLLFANGSWRSADEGRGEGLFQFHPADENSDRLTVLQNRQLFHTKFMTTIEQDFAELQQIATSGGAFNPPDWPVFLYGPQPGESINDGLLFLKNLRRRHKYRLSKIERTPLMRIYLIWLADELKKEESKRRGLEQARTNEQMRQLDLRQQAAAISLDD